MTVPITQILLPASMYPYKCPYAMDPTGTVAHNTANNAGARAEISYMESNYNEVSYHVAIDDKEAIQGIPFDRCSWNAGDGLYGAGNRQKISFEICYSLSGGARFIQAEKNAAEVIARVHKEFGWGIDRLSKHQDYSGKYCPHRTLDMGWPRFKQMVANELAKLNGQEVADNPTPDSDIDVIYQCYDSTHGWLSEVTNYNDSNTDGYAGWIGYPVTGLIAYTPGAVEKVGNLEYRLHVKNGGWFNWRRDREVDVVGDTFAGDLKQQCDGLQMRLVNCPGHSVDYCVHLKAGGWLDWITGAGDGDNVITSTEYAGIWGKTIDAVKIAII